MYIPSRTARGERERGSKRKIREKKKKKRRRGREREREPQNKRSLRRDEGALYTLGILREKPRATQFDVLLWSKWDESTIDACGSYRFSVDSFFALSVLPTAGLQPPLEIVFRSKQSRLRFCIAGRDRVLSESPQMDGAVSLRSRDSCFRAALQTSFEKTAAKQIGNRLMCFVHFRGILFFLSRISRNFTDWFQWHIIFTENQRKWLLLTYWFCNNLL